MRIGSWASVLVLASTAWTACTERPAPSHAPPAAAEASVASAVTENGRTQLTLQIGSARTTVALDRDATVAADAVPRVNVLASVPGRAIVVVDIYPSAAGGMSYCQAGEEAFLRVIAISGQTAAARHDVKIASCRDNLELADPGLDWDMRTNTVQIHWLMGPSRKDETRKLGIRPDGSVETHDGGRP